MNFTGVAVEQQQQPEPSVLETGAERGRQDEAQVDEVDGVLGVNVRLWILDFSI